MRWLIITFCLVLIIKHGFCVMSEKQMKATKKLVRNTCVTKSKIAPEVVDAMYSGDFSKGQISPDGTFDWEGGIKTINANAPASIAEPASVSVEHCKNSLKNKNDKCLGAAQIAECLYKDNPSNYFLP